MIAESTELRFWEAVDKAKLTARVWPNGLYALYVRESDEYLGTVRIEGEVARRASEWDARDVPRFRAFEEAFAL